MQCCRFATYLAAASCNRFAYAGGAVAINRPGVVWHCYVASCTLQVCCDTGSSCLYATRCPVCLFFVTTCVPHPHVAYFDSDALTTIASYTAYDRPGDTIWLAPGMAHSANNIPILWPLLIIGGGKHPDDTIIHAQQASDAALEFHASAKVSNLSISSTLGPCIMHRRGALLVERCQLTCQAKGLEHLVSPLVTVAAATGMTHGMSQKVSVMLLLEVIATTSWGSCVA